MNFSENFFLILFILIVIFVLIFFIFVWPIVLSIKPVLPPPIEYSKSSYGSRCNNNPCYEDLVCVPYSDITSLCKVPIGGQCNSLFECTPDALICSDVCALSSFGGINQKGPCNNGLVLNS